MPSGLISDTEIWVRFEQEAFFNGLINQVNVIFESCHNCQKGFIADVVVCWQIHCPKDIRDFTGEKGSQQNVFANSRYWCLIGPRNSPIKKLFSVFWTTHNCD